MSESINKNLRNFSISELMELEAFFRQKSRDAIGDNSSYYFRLADYMMEEIIFRVIGDQKGECMEDLKIISDKPIEIYTISSAAKSLGVSKGLLDKGIEDGT